MRDELAECGDGLGLELEDGKAHGLETRAHMGLRGGDHHRLAGLPRERGRILGEGIDVVAGPGHGKPDHERIHGGIAREDGEDLAEEPAVAQEGGGDVDRVRRGGKARQHAV